MTAQDDPVTFIDVPETKPVSAVGAQIKEVQAQAAAKPIKVKVSKPFRVVHEGKPYSDGDMLEVPPDIAEVWLTAKWVEKTTAKTRTKEK